MNLKFEPFKLDILDLREQINLSDFARYKFGYEIDYGRTDKGFKYHSLYKKNKEYITENITEKHIIIFKRQDDKSGRDTWFYKNVSGNYVENINSMVDDMVNSPELKYRLDKGSIIDLIQFEMMPMPNIGKCRQIAEYFYNHEADKVPQSIPCSTSKPIPVGKFENIAEHFDVKPIDGFNAKANLWINNYFEQRRFPPSICDDPHFKNSIFYRSYQNAAHKSCNNIVYPIYAQEGTCGFIQHNKQSVADQSFKGVIGFKNAGMWLSYHDTQKPLTHLFIAESPMDCIAHYLLHPSLRSENVKYAASGGEFTQEQIKFLEKNVLLKYNPQNIGLIFDNDIAGAKFSLQFLANSNYNPKTKSEFLPENNIQAYPYTNNNVNRVDIIFSKNAPVNFNLIDTKFKELNTKIDNASILVDGNKFTVDKIDNLSSGVGARVSFRSSHENWEHFNMAFRDIKYQNNQEIIIQKPFSKDFNDDLILLNKTNARLVDKELVAPYYFPKFDFDFEHKSIALKSDVVNNYWHVFLEKLHKENIVPNDTLTKYYTNQNNNVQKPVHIADLKSKTGKEIKI